MEKQICKKCGKNKILSDFATGKNKRKGIEIIYVYKTCKLCDGPRLLEKSRRYKKNNRSKLAEKQKIYHESNKDNDSLTKKIWYLKNKDSVNLRVKNNISNRRKTDPIFRIKENISCIVRSCVNKNRESIKKYLPYSIDELKNHLEQQFEPWMTWQNYGVYRVDIWNDTDPKTWTWQIDHIVPHSKFKYVSMKDEEFKQCWSLSNLRPYSAKQNIIDGVRSECKKVF